MAIITTKHLQTCARKWCPHGQMQKLHNIAHVMETLYRYLVSMFQLMLSRIEIRIHELATEYHGILI